MSLILTFFAVGILILLFAKDGLLDLVGFLLVIIAFIAVTTKYYIKPDVSLPTDYETINVDNDLIGFMNEDGVFCVRRKSDILK